MTLQENVTIFLLLVILVLYVWLKLANRKIGKYESKQGYRDQGAINSKVGKTVEQFIPFLKDFPYDPAGFKFLGQPLDGIFFGDDRIIFLEFKTGGGQLTPRQNRLRYLIERKKVSFELIKM